MDILNDGYLFLEIQQGDMVILVLHFKFVRATDIWTPNQGIVGTILYALGGAIIGDTVSSSHFPH